MQENLKAQHKTRKTLEERFMEKVCIDASTGCWVWNACYRKTGYGAFGIGNYVDYAHRAAWRIYKGDIPESMYVCHKCDVRGCVNPDHLFIGTAKENMQDASKKGRVKLPAASYASNENHQVAKLTNEQVLLIRSKKEIRPSVFAKKFGVTYHAIWMVRTHRTFRDV